MTARIELASSLAASNLQRSPTLPGQTTGAARQPASTRAGDSYDPTSPPLIARLRRLAAGLRAAQSAGANANTITDALDTAQGRLDELRTLVGAEPGAPAPADAKLASAVDEIRSIADSIAAAAGAIEANPFHTIGFRIENLDSDHVAGVKGSAHLPEGTRISVDVQVLASAQTADARLDFGAPQIDLASFNSVLRLEVTGSEGTRELWFASGTAISDMAAQINSLAGLTGVHAKIHALNAIDFSTDFGSDEFVSIRVIDDGGLVNDARITDENAPSSSTAIETGAQFESIHGADVQGTINGVVATGQGLTLSTSQPGYNFTITLSESAAQWLHPFHAFDLVGTDPSAQLNPGQPPDVVPFRRGSDLAREAQDAAERLAPPAESGREPTWDALQQARSQLADVAARARDAASASSVAAFERIDADFQSLLAEHTPERILDLFPPNARPHALTPSAVLSLIPD